MTKLAVCSLLSASLLGAPAPADASTQTDASLLDFQNASRRLTTGGPAAKVLLAPSSGTFSMVTGGRGASFLTQHLYLGGAAFGGSSPVGGLAYGGFIGGYEQPLGPRQAIALGALLGGGYSGGGGLAVEPELSVSHRFGGGFVGAFTASYLYAPAMPAINGAMVGLRLDFKQLVLSLPVDE